MLHCNETVTLIQRDRVADSYVCTMLQGASWFAKTAVVVSGEGAKPVSTLKCRIPEGVLPPEQRPEVGDYLVRGPLAALERPAELLGREYFKVTAVGDNRRGNLKHWAVSGA